MLTKPTVAERFWSKVRGDDYRDCWIWTASCKTDQPYGQFTVIYGTTVAAHRWAYEFMFGPIPDGLHLDHLCRNPPCVNPWHLEPVTPLVNTRRGVGHGKETHCPQGHPYDETNTYYEPKRLHRMCRTCARESDRKRYPERYERKKAALTDAPHPGPSLYRGVTWDKINQTWVARTRANGKRIYIGSYHSEDDAGQAYAQWQTTLGRPEVA